MTRPRNLTPHIHGGRLVLPAAVLLGTFTHYPAVATFIQSLFSTPRGSRPARFVGGENYQAMLQDPVFWQSLENNLIFALGTIPLRSEEHTSELQSLMRISYAVFCLKKKKPNCNHITNTPHTQT